MSRPRSRFGGTRNYAWFILIGFVTVFAASLWIRLGSKPRLSELERLVAQYEPDEHVHALATATDGTTYVGTHLGLLAGKALKGWAQRPGFSGDVLAVQVGSDGKVFLGGEFGIVSYTPDRTEPLLVNAVTALAVDPANHGRLLAFVKSSGLMVTPDLGRTWRAIHPFKGYEGLTIAIDPHDPNRIAVGGSDGFLALSGDGGTTWNNAGSFQEMVTSLLFDPTEPGRLWGAIGGTVRYSDDAGTTWRTPANAPKGQAIVALGTSGDPRKPVLAATSQGYLYTPSPK